MVVRRHGDADFQGNPQLAADEFRLMRILKAAGVAAPAPYYVDESGEIFDRPVVVIEFIDGQTEFAPSNPDDYFFQIAAHLARIHRVGSAALDFLPQNQIWPEKLDDSFDEARIRAALDKPLRNPLGLIHGDFWPGNILWKDGQLVAVIDWEDAAISDPLADVANAREEILWALGVEAMENFTRQYQALNPIDFDRLPYWDLRVALRTLSRIGRWGLEADVEKKMRDDLRFFIEQAL
jgi:aminoglycoside phosphotransferase (APT) family kinase protein